MGDWEIDTFRSILVKVRAAFRCHTKKCGQRYDISEQTFVMLMPILKAIFCNCKFWDLLSAKIEMWKRYLCVVTIQSYFRKVADQPCLDQLRHEETDSQENVTFLKKISFPSENTKWTINMNFIHNKVWSKVSQVQRLLQQPHAFLLLRCHTHTFTFHFGSQTFILDIASHFSNDLTTNLYRGSSWLGRNRALEVIKMSICIQITQKK